MLLYPKETIAILVFLLTSVTCHSQDIYFRDPAFPINAISTENNEQLPVRSADGRSLFFLRLPTTTQEDKQTPPGIWYADQFKKVWKAPQKMKKAWYRAWR